MASSEPAQTAGVTIPESLISHNAHFTKLVSLIPARYYIPLTQEEADSKWMKNKKNKAGVVGSEQGKESKKKARMEKFDPANNLTADQILAGASKPLAKSTESSIPIQPLSSSQVNPATSSSSSSTTLAPALPPQIAPLPPSASIADLKARMRTKLGNMAAARGVVYGDAGGDESGEGLRSRDALMDERRARRAELRDKRREKRKMERKKVAESGKPAKNNLIVPAMAPSDNHGDSLMYPSLSLPSSKRSSNSGNLPGLKKLSNPSQALAQLEKHKAKISGLSDDARKEAEERERWAKAEIRASGGKVADEEKVLKKAIKREEKRKMKSSKEWAERKKDLERSQAIAVKKRSDNIAQRADARRKKRLGVKDKNKMANGKSGGGKKGGSGPGGKKGGKKGRPGFEGKSSK